MAKSKKSTVIQKHTDTIAFEAWKETEEGMVACNPRSFGSVHHKAREYLENRLENAFQAGLAHGRTALPENPSHFRIMEAMSVRDQDIACCPHIYSAQKLSRKKSGRITMQVDVKWTQKVLNSMVGRKPEYLTLLYIVNAEEFEQLKNG